MEHEVDMPTAGVIETVLQDPELLVLGATLNKIYMDPLLRGDQQAASVAAVTFLSSYDEARQEEILLGALTNAYLNHKSAPVLWDPFTLRLTEAALARLDFEPELEDEHTVYRCIRQEMTKAYNRLRINNTWFQFYRYFCAHKRMDIPERMQEVPHAADYHGQLIIREEDRTLYTSDWAKQEVERRAQSGHYNRRAIEIRRNMGGHLMPFLLDQGLSLGNISKQDLDGVKDHDVLILHFVRWNREGLDCIVENVSQSAFHMRRELPLTLTLTDVQKHLPNLPARTTIFKVRVAMLYDTRFRKRRIVLVAPVVGNHVRDFERSDHLYQSIDGPMESLSGTLGLSLVNDPLLDEIKFLGGRYWAALKPLDNGQCRCLLIPRPLGREMGDDPFDFTREVPFLLSSVAEQLSQLNHALFAEVKGSPGALLDQMLDVEQLVQLYEITPLRRPFLNALVAYTGDPALAEAWVKRRDEGPRLQKNSDIHDLTSYGFENHTSEFCDLQAAHYTPYHPDGFNPLNPETWHLWRDDDGEVNREFAEFLLRLMEGHDD